MVDDIVNSVVTVHHSGFVAGRDIFRQPFDEVFHCLDVLGLGGSVLFDPAADLALNVVTRLAKTSEPNRLIVDAV